MAEQAEPTSVAPDAGNADNNTASNDVVNAETQTNEAKAEGDKPEAEAKKEEPKQDPAKGYVKRIDRLTAEKYKLKNELDQLRNEVAAIRKQQAPEQVPTDPDEKIAYLARKEAEKLIAERTQAEQQAKAQEEAFRVQQERIAKAQEVYPDYIDKLSEFDNSGRQVAQDVVEAIGMQPNAADMLYYIASNPDEAALLAPNVGTPASRLYALMRLQAKVEQAPKVEVTAAPAPTPNLRGAAVVNPSLDSMEMEKFHAMRMKQRHQSGARK